MKEWKKERDKRVIYLFSLSFRSPAFCSSSQNYKVSPRVPFVTLLTSVLSRLADIGGKNHRFIARLVVHQILMFYPSVPVAVNFLETLLCDFYLVL